MIKLSDCGKIVKVRHINLNYDFKTKIQMVIKAPGGTLVIYNSHQCNDNIKGEAIKAFMEVHKND